MPFFKYRLKKRFARRISSKDEIYAEFAEIEKTLDEKLAPLGIECDKLVEYTKNIGAYIVKVLG